MLVNNIKCQVSIDFSMLSAFKIGKICKNKMLFLQKDTTMFFCKIPGSIQCFFDNTERKAIFYVQELENLPLLLTFEKKLRDSFTTKNAFKKRLDLKGLGYKIFVAQNDLKLKIGYSHPVIAQLPVGINSVTTSKKKNKLTIRSFDKIRLGNLTKRMCTIKKQDPYKGKGFSLAYVNKKLKKFKKK